MTPPKTIAQNNKEHPLYCLWLGMRQRCNNKSSSTYHHYGDRGIKICKRWDNFKLFSQDMGPRPTPNHTLDRINNKKGYSPSNCRWASKLEQSLNRRISYECHKGHKWTKENTMITSNGRKNLTRRCKICFLKRIKEALKELGGNGE